MDKEIYKKAAWNIFGKSYEYREKYNSYKERKKKEEKEKKPALTSIRECL